MANMIDVQGVQTLSVKSNLQIDHKTSTIYIQGVKIKLVPRYFDTPLKIIKMAKNGLP